MNIRSATILSMHHVFAMMVVLASVAGLRGDPIRVSKPAVEIATPAKDEPKVAEVRPQGFDFAAPPDMARPVAPQPSIIRIAPRERDREEEEDRLNPHDLWRLPGSPKDEKNSLRTSPLLRPGNRTMIPGTYPPNAGSSEQNSGAYASSPGLATMPGTPRINDASGTKQMESSRALAPITDFDWNGRESLTRPSRHSGEERDDQWNKSPFAPSNDSDETSARPTTFFELLTVRPKEKPSPELLERRASFEQLLNPSAGLTAKTGGSLDPVLDPVSSLDASRPVATLAVPTIGMTAKTAAATADPMQAMNQRHERLRGPVVEDVNSKYSAQPGFAAPGAIDGRYQTPLSRQPIIQPFPSRKF